MEILLFKKTRDSDLHIGLKVCYQNAGGVYNRLGTITDTYTSKGITHYLLNTSFGAYLAEEVKLIKWPSSV